MAALAIAAAPLKKGRKTEIQIPDDERPRYAIKTLDVAEEAQTPCACFVVPRGREHEFVFSSDEGLAAAVAPGATAGPPVPTFSTEEFCGRNLGGVAASCPPSRPAHTTVAFDV